MNKITNIYNTLLEHFNKQGWWPLSRNGIPEHHVGNPKTQNEKFEIVIGAILTQNINWKNVEKALTNLNKKNLINPVKIKSIKKEKLAKLIRPSGYFNQKAERLKLIAGFFLKNKNPTRAQLLELKGIGPETADSILLYAYQQPTLVIDAYTKRFYSRFFNKELNYDELKNIFENNLEKESKIFNEFHALLVELGKNYCKSKKPLCKECPLNVKCSFEKVAIDGK